MKKLGIFALLLSLTAFSFGCAEEKKAPAPPANPPAPAAGEEKPAADAGTEDKVEDGAGAETKPMDG